MGERARGAPSIWKAPRKREPRRSHRTSTALPQLHTREDHLTSVSHFHACSQHYLHGGLVARISSAWSQGVASNAATLRACLWRVAPVLPTSSLWTQAARPTFVPGLWPRPHSLTYSPTYPPPPTHTGRHRFLSSSRSKALEAYASLIHRRGTWHTRGTRTSRGRPHRPWVGIRSRARRVWG